MSSTKLFDITGKNILVTGGSSGNGLAIVRALNDMGANVTAVDIKRLPKDIDKAVQFIQCDLSDIRKVDSVFSGLEALEALDVLVNNAGITIGNHTLEYTLDDWQKTHNVNLLAPFRISQHCANKMKLNNKGSIINISSLAAELGFPGNPAYVASKGGLKLLTKAMAYDLSEFNIRVNSIGPGYIKTSMTKKSWNDEELRTSRTQRTLLNRWGEGTDLIGAVVFLSSVASEYITGQEIYVDGGWLSKGL